MFILVQARFLNEMEKEFTLACHRGKKTTKRCFTFTKHGPFVLAHVVRRIKRREQSLHTNSNTAAISTSNQAFKCQYDTETAF
jgi:hypothetical protein